MEKTLICTLGTSLKTNIERALSSSSPEGINMPRIEAAYRSGDWKNLSESLLELQPDNPFLGAEINTIEFILQRLERKGDKLSQIVFLVSDTDDGKNMGKVLENYYSFRSTIDSRLDGLDIKLEIVEGLQDRDPKKFKKEGLLNLVRKISKIISKTGKPEKVLIDATGGYKAQIAIAVMFGQAFGVDVIYKHEKFPEIIEFPSMPVTLDYSYFFEFNHLFSFFWYRNNPTISFSEFSEYFSSTQPIRNYSELANNKDFSKIKLFFEDETINDEHYFSLNHAGIIYIEAAFKNYVFTQKKTLPPELPESRREEPRLTGDHHYPQGFLDYIKKIWNKEKWISTIICIPYDKERGIPCRGFKIAEIDDEHQIIGFYRDNNYRPARFRILIGTELDTLTAYSAVQHLNSNIDCYD
ncbi:MAG: putative CRISPR-associated protein [Spirochaetaceae bacterium]|nr:putative CRISPR-associated protein [Spirochaetaceae bacterium]